MKKITRTASLTQKGGKACAAGKKGYRPGRPDTERNANNSGVPALSAAHGWSVKSSLFAPLPPILSDGLQQLARALKIVRPLKKQRQQELPDDIFHLSRLLTRERSEMRHPYWSKPGWMSAYLYYFLPWNIIRIGRLLGNLGLPEPAVRDNALPLLLDAGSGPLTLPIALWLTKPHWRNLPIRVLALDSSRQPMETGAKLLEQLASLENLTPWRVTICQGPVESLAVRHKLLANSTWPWLVSAANILNELRNARRRKFDNHDSDNNTERETVPQDAMAERLYNILEAWAPLWHPDMGNAPLLFIEPGTRLGGTAIMRLRQTALHLGLKPVSPCTHSGHCPLLREDTRSSLAHAWCHFTFSAENVSPWLTQLSREAGLAKNSLSLSLLFLAASGIPARQECAGMPVRVLSQPFIVPRLPGKARYGCARCGLGLLPQAEELASGSLVAAQKPSGSARDTKSGATILQSFSRTNATSKHFQNENVPAAAMKRAPTPE